MARIKKMISGVWYFIRRNIEDNVGLYAAQASFFLTFSSIPLVMFILTVAKYFLPFFVSEHHILTSISSFVPPPINTFLTTIVTELFNRTSDVPIISITAATTLWLASRGFMALYLGINNVFNKDNMPNYFYCRAISILYTLIFAAVLLMTMAVFGFGGKIAAFIGDRANTLSAVITFVLRAKVLIFTALLSLFFAAFYRFMAKSELSFKNQLPGALGAALGWLLFSYGYSIYIKYFSRYTYVYGSLTAVVFLMLWIYFCMNILLYGAELNKILAGRFPDGKK